MILLVNSKPNLYGDQVLGQVETSEMPSVAQVHFREKLGLEVRFSICLARICNECETTVASILADPEISMNPDDVDRREQNEVHELCDGCRKPHPTSELFLIGDGSIKVCPTCRGEATWMMRE